MSADYVMGHDPLVLEALGRRRADVTAAFLLPHLRPGQRLLDAGCGPGSVTVGLAQAVAPGLTVALDIDEASLAAARSRARAQGCPQVAFQRADVDRLPLRAESLDVVYLSGVLAHQAERRPAVLAEARRVLKPGGLIAVSDADYGATLLAPAEPRLTRAWGLVLRVLRARSADPFGARGLRARLRAAGFTRVSGSASTETWGDPEATRDAGFFWAWFLGRRHADRVVASRWATHDELRACADAFLAWGAHPDALLVRVRCEAIGFKG